MDRRQFIKTTAASTILAGASLPELQSTASACTIKKSQIDAPAVLKTYTGGDHRRRLENIAICNKSIRKYMRKHLITDYLPGHAIYNLGEYQIEKPWEIGEYDEQELDRLRSYGVKLIQLHECWNDPLRLFGGNKFTPVNPQGFKRFVDMVHARRMKLIPYISTGYFPVLDPDFREEWARSKPRLTGLWNNYAFCSPASSSYSVASWRASTSYSSSLAKPGSWASQDASHDGSYRSQWPAGFCSPTGGCSQPRSGRFQGLPTLKGKRQEDSLPEDIDNALANVVVLIRLGQCIGAIELKPVVV